MGASLQRSALDHGVQSASGQVAGPGEDCSLLLFLWPLLGLASVASSNGSIKKCLSSGTTLKLLLPPNPVRLEVCICKKSSFSLSLGSR